MTKQAVFALCLSGGHVLVDFDPRVVGVVVPLDVVPRHNDHHCCLEYGFGMPVPMDGFEVSDRGIKAVLSFNRRAFETFVPWPAVFGIGPSERSSRTMWWEDVPIEVGAVMVPRTQRRPLEVV